MINIFVNKFITLKIGDWIVDDNNDVTRWHLNLFWILDNKIGHRFLKIFN